MTATNKKSPKSGGLGEHPVVARLLQWGRSPEMGEVLEELSLAAQCVEGAAEADQLLRDDPFAFLLGVIADYLIRAERAWRFPYELRTRLGYLAPRRIAQEPDAVHRAVDTPPKLHRFAANVAIYSVAAARIVCDRYGGDASAIWGDSPTAHELQERLRQFPGIGQKKAAMAVMILASDRGVPLADMSGSNVAYDRHVRRVFLRTQLAQVDDVDHMVAIARSANPECPGALDLPAWLIGKKWCRPVEPVCGSCPLTGVCPKDVWAAANMRDT